MSKRGFSKKNLGEARKILSDEYIEDLEAMAKNKQLDKAITAFNDPWKHRSKGMACGGCMWYVSKVDYNGENMIGRCRRHAPTMSGYPAVFPADWCGDHKLDENKVIK